MATATKADGLLVNSINRLLSGEGLLSDSLSSLLRLLFLIVTCFVSLVAPLVPRALLLHSTSVDSRNTSEHHIAQTAASYSVLSAKRDTISGLAETVRVPNPTLGHLSPHSTVPVTKGTRGVVGYGFPQTPTVLKVGFSTCIEISCGFLSKIRRFSEVATSEYQPSATSAIPKYVKTHFSSSNESYKQPNTSTCAGKLSCWPLFP
jgi:hypothetical protein